MQKRFLKGLNFKGKEVKKMKRCVVVIALAMFLGLGSAAYAMPIMIDVGAAGITGTLGDADTRTGVFDELGLYIQTTSTLLAGNLFTDIGDLRVTELLSGSPIDTEGLNQLGGWELTGRWDNLSGFFTPGAGVTTYTYQAGTVNFYADQAPDFNFNTWQLGSSDDVAATFTNAKQMTGIGGQPAYGPVATAQLMSGTGHIWFDTFGNPTSGDTLTEWKFSYMLPNFWLDALGNDLSPYVSSVPGFWIKAEVDTNTHKIILALPNIYSTHDGSVSMEVVPEPATLLLFGSGLIGMAGFARRKFGKKGKTQ